MSETNILSVVFVPASLGFLGFVEPCSIGTTAIFIKYVERKGATCQIAETIAFTAARALSVGALGATAAVSGSAFLGFQRGAWIALGSAYIVIGLLYATGRAGPLMVALGPGFSRIHGLGASVGLGVLLGLNIPACAAPLLLALLASAAAQGATGAPLVNGFLSLGIFGLALSLPLVVFILIPATRRWLDWLSSLSSRFPSWAGVLLVALGAWSIGFGLFADVEGGAARLS